MVFFMVFVFWGFIYFLWIYLNNYNTTKHKDIPTWNSDASNERLQILRRVENEKVRKRNGKASSENTTQNKCKSPDKEDEEIKKIIEDIKHHTLAPLKPLILWAENNDIPIDRFPRNIEALDKISVLNLSYLELKYIPAEIGKLSNLTSLDLSYNQLQELPGEISHLSKLQTLILYNNGFIALPNQFWSLTQLIHLDLRWTPFLPLPVGIFYLPRLEYLGFCITNDNERPSVIPKEIKNLVRLKTLKIDGEVSKLPSDILNLPITKLSLIGFEFKVPDLVWKMVGLEELEFGDEQHFSGSTLQVLPPEIGLLKELVTINLAFCNLTSLPDEFYSLYNLKHLYLAGNKNIELSEHLGDLTNLEYIDLMWCRDVFVPHSAGKLPRLDKEFIFYGQTHYYS